MPQRATLVLSALLAVACGGAAAEPETSSAEATPTSSGGEAPPDEGGGAEAAPAPAAPVVLRTTIPVPVPQPAVAREELSEALQAVWTDVEEQVQLVRPEGPEETTVENVQAWADGPFRAWLDERRLALERTQPRLAEIANDPPWERAIGLALWAYAFEDFGAQIAGAPVPDRVARDRELRDIYIASLNEGSVPLGQRAVELYADCQRRLAALGDDSPWLPWRAYCVQRGQEVIEGYGLDTTARPTPENAPDED